MKILYVTDIHGRTGAYEIALERAVASGVEAIVNGGDVYPLGRDLFGVQREFLEDYLPAYLERCRRHGIAYLATLGNMDLRGHDSAFRRLIAGSPQAHCLLEQAAEVGGYTFIGSAMTTDGPFALKDRCLRDLPESPAGSSGDRALVSDESGIREVSDWGSRVAGIPSLAEHLRSLPLPENPRRTVYVLHQPPGGAGQGIISSGADVGSRAVARFLAERRVLLSLHGHIHESPFSGGRWRAEIGDTTCLQPGQLSGSKCVTVVIDLDSLQMERVF
jgi:Icc-related predicted phosphoesterase